MHDATLHFSQGLGQTSYEKSCSGGTVQSGYTLQTVSITVWDADRATQRMSDSVICKCENSLKDQLDYQNYHDNQEVHICPTQHLCYGINVTGLRTETVCHALPVLSLILRWYVSGSYLLSAKYGSKTSGFVQPTL